MTSPDAAAAAPLALRLLGEMAVLRDGRAVDLPRSRKTRALLAYLALSTRPRRRDALCAMFWDRPDDPKGALRWSLSKLRPLLDDGTGTRLRCDGELVQVDTSGLAVDALRLQGVLKGAGEEDVVELEALAAAGEVLEGFSLPRCPNFELWLAEQRDTLRRARLAVLQRLYEHHQAQPEEALVWARAIVETAPADGEARLRLIDLLLRTGRKSEADRQRELARDLLAGSVHHLMRQEATHTQTPIPEPAPVPSPGVVPAPQAPETEPLETAASLDLDLTPPNRPSIAVLPFQTLGADDQVFAVGLTHDIIMRISRLRWLFVIARGSAFNILSESHDVQDIARKLGVRYVTQGTVAVSGGKLRVDVALIDAPSRTEIWVEQYTRPLDDIFTVQQEISDAIARCLQIEIEEAEQRRALHEPVSSLDAWSAYHRGVWHMHRFREEDLDLAEQFFNRAIELEPAGPRPYAGLSFVEFQRAFLRLDPDYQGRLDRSLELAERSIAAEPREALGHWALGRTLLMFREYDQSIDELQSAIKLNPNFAGAHFSLSRTLFAAGESERGIESTDTARRLSPYDPLRFAMLSVRANCLVQLGRFEEAAEWVVRAARQPNAHHHIVAIAAYCTGLAGRDALARQFLDKLRAVRPDYSLEDFLLAFPLKEKAHVDLVRDGMRKAGLGE